MSYYYNRYSFNGGGDEQGVLDVLKVSKGNETVKSITWLALCTFCVGLTVLLIVSVHLKVINRYKEFKKEDTSEKTDTPNDTQQPTQ